MKIFEIQPSSNTVLFVVIPLCLLLLALIVLVAAFYASSKRAGFAINNDELEIRATLYSRKVPLAEIRREGIEPVDLEEDAGLKVKWRTNGIALPGYSEGWFRLKNGKKALLFVTDKKKLVLVPTVHDYIIIVSPADPAEFIRALKN